MVSVVGMGPPDGRFVEKTCHPFSMAAVKDISISSLAVRFSLVEKLTGEVCADDPITIAVSITNERNTFLNIPNI
jgi:hypothetical protein